MRQPLKALSKTPLTAHAPLSDRVADALREEIRKSYHPGERLPTIRQLADRFEVSINTVHHALAVLRREGSVEGWAGSGTYVKDRATHQHVAVVMGLHPERRREGNYYLRLANYLYHFFADETIAVRLYWAPAHLPPSAHDVSLEDFQRAVSRDEVAGVLILKGPLDDRWRTAFAQAGVPVVGGDSPHKAGIDYAEFLRLAIRHLVQHGRRRLGLLVWRDEEAQRVCPWLTDVIPQFQELVREAGGETCTDWIRHDLDPLAAGSGYELFRELWTARPEKPDGLVIGDDMLFADFATAALEIGIRVPADLMVVTHANKDSGALYPFPTVRLEYDPDEAGQALGRLLLRLLRKEAVAEGTTKISFNWVGREANDAGRGSLRSMNSERAVENQNPVTTNQGKG